MMKYSIFYGFLGKKIIDVTKISYEKMMKQGIILIPKNDHSRAAVYGDPLEGVHKFIYIYNQECDLNAYYSSSENVYIDTINNAIYTDKDVPQNILNIYPSRESLLKKLNKIHSELYFNDPINPSINDELPEQLMAVRYLKGDEKVLELGANTGRNTLNISKLLNDSSNLVTLECDPNTVKILTHNRDKNNLKFHIEGSALSKRKLIQRHWDTMVSDIVIPGWVPVSIISYEELMNKYKIEFDTLVLDCEGAFYYILMDMPEILNGIKTIIMENDYWEIEKKHFVDRKLRENGFIVDYSEEGGWGPCQSFFFQVWVRK